MADSPIFDWVAAEIERQTHLERMQARGALRLALKRGGIAPSDVLKEQMRLLLMQLIPAELTKCGVEDAENVCGTVRGRLEQADLQSPHAAEEDLKRIFSFGKSS